MRSEGLTWPYRLPLGAVVATCTLVDCVPIVDRTPGSWVGIERRTRPDALLRWNEDGRAAVLNDQLPYGDFTPGRFGWLLDNIVPIKDPQPQRGGQRLWNWEEAV